MKKLTVLVAALVLTLGLAQCKKEQTPIANANEGVMITLNVGHSTGSGANGSRVNVDPNATDQVTFANGDQILVASNGRYVGTLTHNGTSFSGEIADPVEGQRLYFYFLGNKQGTLEANATSCTVNISDQTTETGLPVISMGKSTVDYSSDVTSYSSRLYNKCSLMKFVVETPSTAAICITGMNNTVTVNFASATDDDNNNGFIYDMDGDGLIKMPAKDENNVTWAIVLQQGELTEGEEGSAYTADNAYTGIRPAMDAIAMNTFLDEGKALTLNTAAVTAPEGAINGLFSVSATKQVYFSKGNLQYIGSAGNGDDNNTGAYWKFAENQWDNFGNESGHSGSSNQNADRDLFRWATSGYNHGARAYQPWSTDNTSSSYNAYGAWNKNLYDSKDDGSMKGQADWGYNAISNGGNLEGQWRTLTTQEWQYVFNTRSMANVDFRYTLGKRVKDVLGIIIYPDDYAGSAVSSDLSEEEWAAYQAAGCVFLPAAGCITTNWLNVGSFGYYWSASSYYPSNDQTVVYSVGFSNKSLKADKTDGRSYRLSVRLVRDAN